jgi:hypothetical protein
MHAMSGQLVTGGAGTTFFACLTFEAGSLCRVDVYCQCLVTLTKQLQLRCNCCCCIHLASQRESSYRESIVVVSILQVTFQV